MKKVTLLLVLVVVVIPFTIFSQGKKDNKSDVATVNGVKITREAWNARLESAFGRRVLEQIIVEELIRQEVAKQKIKIENKEIDERISEIKAQSGSPERFNQLLSQNNITIQELKNQIRLEISLEKIVEKEINAKDIEKEQKEKKITKDNAKRLLLQQKIPEYIDQLRKKAKIEINL